MGGVIAAVASCSNSTNTSMARLGCSLRKLGSTLSKPHCHSRSLRRSKHDRFTMASATSGRSLSMSHSQNCRPFTMNSSRVGIGRLRSARKTNPRNVIVRLSCRLFGIGVSIENSNRSPKPPGGGKRDIVNGGAPIMMSSSVVLVQDNREWQDL